MRSLWLTLAGLLVAVVVLFVLVNIGYQERALDPSGQPDEMAALESNQTLNTVNTTRVGSDDPIETAVAVAQIIYPATEEENSPGAVVLIARDNLAEAMLAASRVQHFPVNAPLLYVDETGLPALTRNELLRLKPEGVHVDGNTQVYLVGTIGEAVRREVTRLQRLVHDLAELSRAEAGQLPLECRAVAPAEVIHSAADRLRPQFEDKGVGLHLDLPADLPRVAADPGRLLQVLLNLLGNALQYTPAGGTVAVRAWVEEREVRIAVRDTGIGLAPEHLPHLFERFYRVDKSRSRAGGGSGIGLTIARHFVEAQGGRIWASSPGPGQGSTFTFTLPIAP